MEEVINTLELFCNENGISHRFVGGVSFGGLLNEKTTWKIDVKKQTVHLFNYNKLCSYRQDQTLRDIDIILFEKNKEKVKVLHAFCKKNNLYFVTIENAFYNNKVNQLLQFVTAIEIDNNNIPYLVFGNIKQKIS